MKYMSQFGVLRDDFLSKEVNLLSNDDLLSDK